MLSTPRLLLRPWHETDLAAMTAVCNNAAVMRFFPTVQDEARTKDFLSRQHVQFRERGYCFFAAELKATGRVIGFIGLSYLELAVDFAPCVEIGWRLHPDVWGRGLAPEGARECLRFGFAEGGLTEIYAETPLINLPSQRVMAKIGMTEHVRFDHPALADYPRIEPFVAYRITTEEFARERS